MLTVYLQHYHLIMLNMDYCQFIGPQWKHKCIFIDLDEFILQNIIMENNSITLILIKDLNINLLDPNMSTVDLHEAMEYSLRTTELLNIN